jgi:hypothetical protein
VQRSHYEVARTGRARYEAVREHWDLPSLGYRPVDGHITLLPRDRVAGNEWTRALPSIAIGTLSPDRAGAPGN